MYFSFNKLVIISCEIDEGDVVISAYDNAKVKTLEDVRNVTANMYDNSSITTYRDTVVTINDESKITRTGYILSLF